VPAEDSRAAHDGKQPVEAVQGRPRFVLDHSVCGAPSTATVEAAQLAENEKPEPVWNVSGQLSSRAPKPSAHSWLSCGPLQPLSRTVRCCYGGGGGAAVASGWGQGGWTRMARLGGAGPLRCHSARLGRYTSRVAARHATRSRRRSTSPAAAGMSLRLF
jgi:hypothetical protein